MTEAAKPVAWIDKKGEFHRRAALMWVLWHHQGGSSPTGQAVRFALGMGQFDRLTADQVVQAKTWAPGIPGLAHTDAAGVKGLDRG